MAHDKINERNCERQEKQKQKGKEMADQERTSHATFQDLFEAKPGEGNQMNPRFRKIPLSFSESRGIKMQIDTVLAQLDAALGQLSPFPTVAHGTMKIHSLEVEFKRLRLKLAGEGEGSGEYSKVPNNSPNDSVFTIE